MALQINEVHIQHYYMDAIRLVLLGHRYFVNPDCLVIKIRVATAQHSDTALLTRSYVYNLTHFFLWMVGYTPDRSAFHHIVPIVYLANTLLSP